MRGLLASTLAATAAFEGVSAACTRDKITTAASSSGNATGYDFIVVGGGPAGIIAATRLAQSSSKRVLLLDRGQGPTVDTGAVGTVSWNNTLAPIDVPGLSSSISKFTVGDEDLYSAYLCSDVISDVKASCVFGGGASINYMAFPHPTEHDFDDKWPTGWKWSDVSEAADRVWSLNSGTSLPSKDGQWYDQGMYETVSSFLDAQGWSSVNSSAEPNKKTKVYSRPNWDIVNQRRAGPLRTYLPLVEELDNFSYQLNSTVRRVLRDGAQATGVEVETDAGLLNYTLNDGGRVVLAAGPWGTPRILFNSGIGPVEQIQTVANGSTGIPLPPSEDWIELPVGQDVKDHPIFVFYIQTTGNWTAFNSTPVIDGTDTTDIDLYEQEGSGVLAQGYHRMVFWDSNVASDNATRYYQGSVSAQGEGLVLIKGYLTHGATSSGKMGITSNGSVGYTDLPYLRTAADQEGATMFIEGLLESFSSYPGWSMADGYTNASSILSSYIQGDHYIGAANVGTDPSTSVVSADDVSVWGVDNLHVVDSSIHADLPTGNTQPIVMVVAEKAVEKIIAAGETTSSSKLRRRH